MSEQPMKTVRLRTKYYQHFDADLSAEFPAAAYGGWREQELPLSLSHTALVVMHAWDAGAPERYPGWFRAVESLPRTYRIAHERFPPLLAAARAGEMKVAHVASSSDYASDFPGYRPPSPRPTPSARPDAAYEELKAFRLAHVFPGSHNQPDIGRAMKALDFHPAAVPLGDEPVVVDSEALDQWCQDADINHLIYIGFTINGCLLSSPGGMLDMVRRGYLCSTVAEAVTAIENRETVQSELGKSQALWYVALLLGFVYAEEELIKALAPR